MYKVLKSALLGGLIGAAVAAFPARDRLATVADRSEPGQADVTQEVLKGAAIGAAAGGVLGVLLARRARRRAAAALGLSTTAAPVMPVSARVTSAVSQLADVADAAKPRVQHAAELARQRAADAAEAARPKVQQAAELARQRAADAAEAARPQFEHAVEVARDRATEAAAGAKARVSSTARDVAQDAWRGHGDSLAGGDRVGVIVGHARKVLVPR